MNTRQGRLWSALLLATMPVVLTMPAHSETAAANNDAGDVTSMSPKVPAAVEGTPGVTQTASLQALLSGQGFPLTLKLKDLNGEWRCVTISGQSDISGPMGVSAAMLNEAGSYYTRGQTVAVARETYLVAYHAGGKPAGFATLMRAGAAARPALEKLTPETTLSLALLNLRTSGSFKGIRVFDLQREIGGAEKVVVEAPAANAYSSSLSNLNQLGQALAMYTQDYDEVLPPMKDATTMKNALMVYVKNERIFISPITNEAYLPNPILSNKKLAHIVNPASLVSLYEPSPAPDGTRGVCFVDGHTKRIKETEWPQVKKASKIP
ncbi:MAG TPA: hypothetical protein VNA16_10110 [Abditibacteriaceae bacterium]|nr:hypothetical protein [Abditibacteriaceae bacterium]